MNAHATHASDAPLPPAQALVLAAGRGERMRPLTDHTPKPLLPVHGKPLMQWHLRELARAGWDRAVVNTAWLGEQIEAAFGEHPEGGPRLAYSHEGRDFGGALETAGGIANALPLLGTDPFLVINGDVWCDFDPGRALPQAARLVREDCDAWCLLAPNPEHHPDGDFGLEDGRLSETAMPRATFTGIAVYRPGFFAGIPPGTRYPLGPMLRSAAREGRALAAHHDGRWIDVGTPKRLEQLDEWLRNRK